MAWNPSTPKHWLISAAVVFLLSALTYDFVRFWSIVKRYSAEAAEPVLSATSHQTNEAIVVLAGGVFRIPKAFEVLKTRDKAILLISGAGKKTKLTDLVNQQRDAAKNIHTVWDRILIESESNSTWENAEQAKKLLEPKKIEKIILVTSDYHMYRAVKIFRTLLPKMEIDEYPVSSEMERDIIAGPSTNVRWNFFWHFFMEYWKCYWLKVRLFYSFLFSL